MNPPTSLIKSIVLTATIALSVVMTGCVNNKDANNELKFGLADINDTLRSGNLAAAIRMTDALKGKALAEGDSSIWSEIMVQQGINSYYQGNPELLIASTDSAIKWIERQRPSLERARVLAKAYQTHGAYYDQYHFDPDSLAFYLRKSVDNVEKSGIRLDLPQAYGNYANAMRMASSLDSAAIYYHRAINLADSLGLENAEYIPLYNGLAAVSTDMRDFDNGEIWWNKSMDIFESMNQFDKFNTLTGYGNYLYYKEDYPEAKQVFTRLRKMLDSIPESRWEKNFTDVNLSDIYINLGHTSEANELLDSTFLYFSKEQPNPVALSYIHTLQMKSAVADGKFQEALELSKKHPDSDTLRLEQRLARLKSLENIYDRCGNYRQAFLTRKIHDNLNDSLRSYALKHQISTLNAIYQRDHRILNLEANNTQQKAHIYMLIAAVALSIAVIVGLVFIFVFRKMSSRLREEKMMNKIISLRQENLRNRVTPHFIYNALNHELLNTSHGKPSHLDALVGLIRKQQLIASEMLIPFSEELKFVDDYIKVIGDSSPLPLNYTYFIDSDIDPNFLFPSMTLQILVENAFKHGFTSLPQDKERYLDISVRREKGDTIAVSVFNNGTTEPGHGSTGTGLRVLVETIRLINDRHRSNIKFRINYNSKFNDENGYCAIITLSANLKDYDRQE